MKILAHRGYWRSKKEQNTFIAFKRALDCGFGIEFDVRDANKKIVISHEPPGQSAIAFRNLFTALSRHVNFKKATYAVNIKSDGIEKASARLVDEFGITKNSFFFDMSIPSMYIFSKLSPGRVAFACRLSDIEQEPVFYKNAKWLWLDELEAEWINNDIITKYVKKRKSVCLVSPELHGRKHLRKWEQYRLLPEGILKKLFICTDFPVEADIFFNGRKQ